MTTTEETRAEQVERTRTLGDVVWQHTDPSARTVTLTNTSTGASWARDTLGDWRSAQRPAPLAERIGVLLRQPDDNPVDAIAALLRQDIRPWRELLDLGAEAALNAGGNRAWVRCGRDKVAELMYDTDKQPHRIVLVVDDAEAYAASWYADAAAATDAAWAYYCRQQAGLAESINAGEAPGGVYDDRAEAVLEQVKMRGSGQRPGRSWRVEPVADGAQW